MNSLNSILLEGSVVEAPGAKNLPNGSFVCNFRIASDRHFIKDEQGSVVEKERSIFDVEAWSRLGQTCAAELNAGRRVRVVGRLKQHQWTDESGSRQSKIIIVAEHVEFKPMIREATP